MFSSPPSGGWNEGGNNAMFVWNFHRRIHPWFFQLLVAPDVPWLVAGNPLSSSIFTWLSFFCICVQVVPFYKDSNPFGLGAQPNNFIFMQLYRQWHCFQLRSHSQVPRIRTSTSLLGHMLQAITPLMWRKNISSCRQCVVLSPLSPVWEQWLSIYSLLLGPIFSFQRGEFRVRAPSAQKAEVRARDAKVIWSYICRGEYTLESAWCMIVYGTTIPIVTHRR